MATYRGIADHLRWQINEEEMQPGSKLRSELTLAKAFDCNRTTVRRALTVLRTEGLITPVRYKGWFVTK